MRRHLMALLLVGTLAASACGSGSEDPTPSTESTAGSPAATSGTTTGTTRSTGTTVDENGEGGVEVEPVDYLTFAQGTVPVSATLVEGPGDGVSITGAMELIDGSSTPREIVAGGTDETVVEFVYELPAATSFERFAVPEIREVPSPSQTFIREIEVSGSSEGADTGFEVLAEATLEVHEDDDEVTQLPDPDPISVRWVKIRLTGGLDISQATASLDFSELIGEGTQEEVELVDAFTGIWDTYLPDIPDRSTGLIELRQDGATVTGCYENSDLTGTVTGNLASVRGVDRDDGVISLFILNVAEDGSLQGVVSSNGGPFAFFPGNVAPAGSTTDCSDVPEPENPLGCDSVIHGITFEFDSADLRPDSEAILAQLYEGLEADAAASIVVGGHTSTEGDEDYNLELSERRAQAVVDDLVARGIDADRISATGFGETQPLIDPEVDESGRALNRRVEITCA